MIIGIDARMYGSANSGLGRYVEQLVNNLVKIDKENKYVIFLLPAEYNRLAFPDNVKKVLANIPWYSFKEQRCMPKIISREKIDLMHFPHWNVPLFYKGKFVVTIHDLIMYHYPRKEASTHGPLLYFVKDKIHRLIVNHAVSWAKEIIVPSQFTKKDIIQTLNIESKKISTIHVAPMSSKDISRKTNPHEKPYILYVGNAYPHKNLENLLKAWDIFYNKYSKNYDLILVGKKSFFYNKLINSDLPKNNVVFTGYLNDQSLQQYYRHAKLYVFPSLYEGFGLPPLEAMQYHVPVISSNASCLPEILQDAAFFFNPNHLEEIARSINTVLNDLNIQTDLKKKSDILLTKYSGKEMAEKTLKVYKSC